MAFNFNWTPLNTPTPPSSTFISHAKSLLTSALNRPAKPPIIVDDIFVDDLSLGDSAPELEVLEIGDLGEDKFRGVFRMSYQGDAKLTLKTKVQANPLATYLSTTPDFLSPAPLAADAPLTMPIAITLSDFKLSGFVILVFSRDKGITLVFRNDPLESLKVSSTFDSIPYIRSYLQNEIEQQVRELFQEVLPVAVHRLSLRLWNPEYAASLGLMEDTPVARAMPEHDLGLDEEDGGINPLRPSTEGNEPEVFSQKNLLQIAALQDAHRTFSLFTPKIRDAVFRAWAGGNALGTTWERGLMTPSLTPANLQRAFAGAGERPGLPSVGSSANIRPGAGKRKIKKRVINLRRAKTESFISDAKEEEGGDVNSPRVDDNSPRVDEFPTFTEAQEEERTSSSSRHSSTSSFVTARTSESTETFATAHSFNTAPDSQSQPCSPILSPAGKDPLPHQIQDEPARLRFDGKYSSEILQEAFMFKLAHAMAERIAARREKMGGAEGGMWGVEREIERVLSGGVVAEGPPAYRREVD